MTAALSKRHPLADIALPLLKRLGEGWKNEDTATAGLTMPISRLEAAVRGGYAQRRRHWLTGRSQVRLTVAAYDRPRLGLA